MRIIDVLEEQSLNPIMINPENSISEAARVLAKNDVGILVVVDDTRNIIGVLSERDMAKALGKFDGNLAASTVSDLMTEQVITCDQDESIVDGIYAMNKAHFRHLIVAHNGKPVGVLSMRDILKNIEPLLMESKNKHYEQLLMEFLRGLKAV